MENEIEINNNKSTTKFFCFNCQKTTPFVSLEYENSKFTAKLSCSNCKYRKALSLREFLQKTEDVNQGNFFCQKKDGSHSAVKAEYFVIKDMRTQEKAYCCEECAQYIRDNFSENDLHRIVVPTSFVCEGEGDGNVCCCFCKTCGQNLCKGCLEQHKTHSVKFFDNLLKIAAKSKISEKLEYYENVVCKKLAKMKDAIVKKLRDLIGEMEQLLANKRDLIAYGKMLAANFDSDEQNYGQLINLIRFSSLELSDVNISESFLKDDANSIDKVVASYAKVKKFIEKDNKLTALNYNSNFIEYLLYPLRKSDSVLGVSAFFGTKKFTIGDSTFENPNHKFERFAECAKFANLGGGVLLSGGSSKEFSKKAYIIYLDNSRDKFGDNFCVKIRKIADMKVDRDNHSLLHLDDRDKVLACGGTDNDSCEIYDIKNRKWESIKPLNEPRRNASMAYLNKRYVYIFSGYYTSLLIGYYRDNFEMLDLEKPNGGWKIYALSKELCRGSYGVVPLIKDSKILLIGGYCWPKYYDDGAFFEFDEFSASKINKRSCKTVLPTGASFDVFAFSKMGDEFYGFAESSKIFKYDYIKKTFKEIECKGV